MSFPSPEAFESIEGVIAALEAHSYIADRPLATALFLAVRRSRPLLLEGEPGVGKTEVARVLAQVLGTELIRLQCYEGIDLASAVYEWNYAKQLLAIRAMDAPKAGAEQARLAALFSADYLIRRPLLAAIDASRAQAPVLLIDELDRADAEFEAFLLELLSDYAITIPELGTFQAIHPPVVVLTSNRTRDLHDALRRRCIYHWIGYPSLAKELAIVRTRVPEAPEALARQVVAFAQAVRGEDVFKSPGISETLDWLSALLTLGQMELSAEAAQDTLGSLLKYQDDLEKVTDTATLSRLVERSTAS